MRRQHGHTADQFRRRQHTWYRSLSVVSKYFDKHPPGAVSVVSNWTLPFSKVYFTPGQWIVPDFSWPSMVTPASASSAKFSVRSLNPQAGSPPLRGACTPNSQAHGVRRRAPAQQRSFRSSSPSRRGPVAVYDDAERRKRGREERAGAGGPGRTIRCPCSRTFSRAVMASAKAAAGAASQLLVGLGQCR